MSALVHVGLGDRSYQILIDKGLLGRIGTDLKKQNIAKRFCIISDDLVAGLYGDVLLRSMADSGLDVELVTFQHGEERKNLHTLGELASILAQKGFDRKDGLVALGGGVTGDITGFLASVYMRGIPFVQVPTTLLAQVDSSVGGKTGVDIPEGKNLVGTFYQPKRVYIDPETLQSLPKAELLGGLAEVIKYGIIADKKFYDFLRSHRTAVLELDNETIVSVIARCCEIKAWVVEQDELEGGLRRVLNFGHTLGHAIEAASGFRIIHGLAVAMGMANAATLAVSSGFLDQKSADDIHGLIGDYGMEITIPVDLDRETIKNFLKTDKKTVGGKIFFVLPTEIGRVEITDKIKEKEIDAVLRYS